MELRAEGTPVWRQVEAVHIHDDLYRIIRTSEQPEDESWEFETGSIVRCKFKRTQEGDLILAAYEQGKDKPQVDLAGGPD